MISVKNKLEILPGNVLRVPGCEPVTSFTSLALAANVDCNASIITLEDAVNAIIDASGIHPLIVKVLNPSGVPGTGKFLELPSGPPPDGSDCPHGCGTDWYQILKDAATPIDTFGIDEEGRIAECAWFDSIGCPVSQDQFHMAPDPDLRPNTTPLGGVF